MTNESAEFDHAATAVKALHGFFNLRDPQIVDEVLDPNYVQHNPLIPNGPEPIRRFVTSIAAVVEPIIDVKQVVSEGDLAAVHSHYAWTPIFQLQGGRGTAVVDIFRFGPEGKIREHWDVTQAVPEGSANGHTMFDGHGDARATADTEANKRVVNRLFDAMREGNIASFPEMIVEDYIQHNPQVPNGIDGVIQLFASRGKYPVDVKRLIAEGDLVFAHVHYVSRNVAGADIYRLANGKIVEHWDVLQDIPATTASGNDMFSQVT